MAIRLIKTQNPESSEGVVGEDRGARRARLIRNEDAGPRTFEERQKEKMRTEKAVHSGKGRVKVSQKENQGESSRMKDCEHMAKGTRHWAGAAMTEKKQKRS